MKTVAYYIVGGLVFLVLAFFIIGTTNQTSQEIASISVAHAATAEHKGVISFPVEVQFTRPSGRATEEFAKVKFNHFDHQEVACTVCHHTWEGEGPIESCSSAGCHDDYETRNTVNSYFYAYHTSSSASSCVGCHKDLANQGMTNLVVSPCGNNACHPAAN